MDLRTNRTVVGSSPHCFPLAIGTPHPLRLLAVMVVVVVVLLLEVALPLPPLIRSLGTIPLCSSRVDEAELPRL